MRRNVLVVGAAVLVFAALAAVWVGAFGSASGPVDCALEPQLTDKFIGHVAAGIDGLNSILNSRPGSSGVSLASIDKHIEDAKSLRRALDSVVRACLPLIESSRSLAFLDQKITMLVNGMAEARRMGAR
jgi:hypothetical protein